uniref:Protein DETOXIFICATION 16-like n=1 Tax=Nelumbo nucifera TaxID=4432 RepID=A0A822YHE7_NELNU|nr:TPA_asm: hypothetical protein HUJ06_010788 [Nelumbo nucifera]
MISVMFVGHLGELALSGASMATAFTTVTGNSLLLGMGSVLDTLCGQSYGAKQYHMLGIHMQRAMLILLIVSIPIAFILANTTAILLNVGFLQTQNIVIPMMISSGITTLLHLLLCWVLVFKSTLGIRGAALAISISYWINVILLALYIKFSPKCKKTWTGFSKESLGNVLAFLRLAMPSAVMVCLGMWSFEMMVLLSGLLPNPKLETSVLSISLNTAAMVWMIPFGLGGTVSTRVSNELGAEHPRAAHLAVQVVLLMAITEGVLVGLVMILVRRIWGYAYSNEEEVARYAATMMPLLATSNFLDGIQCVLSVTLVISLNLFIHHLGIPSAILLAFILHIGGKGLWMGIICALIVQVLSLLIITIRTNWEEEVKKATHRVYGSRIPTNMAS